jgi:hypothetical protein
MVCATFGAAANESVHGCSLRLARKVSDGVEKVSHFAQEPASNLLGMRQVLPGRFAGLWQRLGAHATPRRVVW